MNLTWLNDWKKTLWIGLLFMWVAASFNHYGLDAFYKAASFTGLILLAVSFIAAIANHKVWKL